MVDKTDADLIDQLQQQQQQQQQQRLRDDSQLQQQTLQQPRKSKVAADSRKSPNIWATGVA